jgi:hypothetical protein
VKITSGMGNPLGDFSRWFNQPLALDFIGGASQTKWLMSGRLRIRVCWAKRRS